MMINDLIPQRAPFQLIEKVVTNDDQNIHTQMLLQEEHVLVESKQVLTAALVENIAQSAAALSGIEAQKSTGGEPKIGVIGSIDKLEILKQLQTPVLLDTFVAKQMDFGSFSLISGVVKVDGEVVAKCEMKIFIHDNA